MSEMKRFTLAETLRLMATECRSGQRTGKSDRWALTLDDAANALDKLVLERDSAREQFDKHVEWAASLEGWQPIETAPKDGTRFDVWAKAWLPAFDRFEYRRFADCYWREADAMGAWKAGIVGADKGWRPTHWMPLPPAPASPAVPDDKEQ